MGGGPNTYPGGVSKWQWKRMQAKKAKQLLKARLWCERQIYEMQKRAELKVAVAELERPWEVVEKAPTLFSVSADGQVKVLADRFQKPGGPYRQIAGNGDFDSGEEDSALESESESENGNKDRYVRAVARNGCKTNVQILRVAKWGMDKKKRSRNGGEFRKQGNASRFRSGLSSLNSGQVGLGRKLRGGYDPKINRSKIDGRINQSNGLRNPRYSESEVFDMSLQQDGSYGSKPKIGRLTLILSLKRHLSDSSFN
ncbi:hypothetical protein GH714_015553 [Hevea brasiliensis]|uniref:Uncharacterized protein n=1 Tax=Hevea brasiliensis TaxID=3981 RepID=A0A6A6NHH0_HEVBR|nr:hypothetical protein GH714_015553 [Hevea brasiliensis]